MLVLGALCLTAAISERHASLAVVPQVVAPKYSTQPSIPAEDSSNAADGKRSSRGDGDTVKVNKPFPDILKHFIANYSPGPKSGKILEAILADSNPAKLAKLCEQMQEEDAEKRKQKEDAGSEGLHSLSDNETHAKATNSKLGQGGKKRRNRTIKKPPRDSKYRKMSDHLWPIF